MSERGLRHNYQAFPRKCKTSFIPAESLFVRHSGSRTVQIPLSASEKAILLFIKRLTFHPLAANLYRADVLGEGVLILDPHRVRQHLLAALLTATTVQLSKMKHDKSFRNREFFDSSLKGRRTGSKNDCYEKAVSDQ